MAQSQSSSNSDNSDKSPPSSSHDNNNNNDNNNNHNDDNGNNGNNNNNNANNHNDNNGNNGNNNNNNNNNGNNNGNNGQNNGNNGQNNGNNGNNNGQNNGNNGNNNGNNGNNQNNGNNNNRNNNNGNNNNGNNHNDNNGNNNNNNGNNGNNNNNNNNGNNNNNNNNNGGNNNDEVNRNNNYWNDKNNNKNNKSPPPPAVSTDSTPSKPSSSSSTTLAGILAGVGVLIVLLVVLIVWLLRRRKMKRQKEYHEAVQYHSNSPKANLPTAQSPYNPNWYNGSHQSEAPSSGAMSQASGWPMPPPAPMMTGEVSGAFSSGPVGPLQPPPHPSVALGFNKSSFTYEELAGATQGFSQGNLLGQGGFGFVHKGILPNGKEIAVKSLKSGSGQGEREFQAEVEIISRVHHRHLVSLVGYCINGGQRMLVYEFVPNNTLEFHLHGKGQPIMDFPSRHKIALGSAKGLSYLHEDCHPRIIHRDIKTANILLDHTFEAKVADFGLAKLSSDNFSHVSTRVMGTFGYLAPEYAASGKLTEKSDVFSYGVVLLELITGRRPVSSSSEEDSLVDWARPQLARVLEEGTFEGVVDPRLENNFNQQELTRMVACAAASIRHSAKKRPKMSQICRALEGDMSLEALNEGGKQGHSGYNSGSYQQDSRTYDSGEYTSSGYGTSSEYAPTGSRDIV